MLSIAPLRARLRAVTAAVGLAALLAAGAAGPAQASDGDTSCDDTVSKQVFASWSDYAWYSLVPRGDLEASTLWGWSLQNGAQRVAGSEPFAVTGVKGAYSLSLPKGSSAVAPWVCVDMERPTFRFFVRNTGNPAATLKVEVLVPNDNGGTQAISATSITAATDWAPSPIFSNQTSIALGDDSEDDRVRYRFTSVGGAFQIDDVHIDPYSRG